MAAYGALDFPAKELVSLGAAWLLSRRLLPAHSHAQGSKSYDNFIYYFTWQTYKPGGRRSRRRTIPLPLDTACLATAQNVLDPLSRQNVRPIIRTVTDLQRLSCMSPIAYGLLQEVPARDEASFAPNLAPAKGHGYINIHFGKWITHFIGPRAFVSQIDHASIDAATPDALTHAVEAMRDFSDWILVITVFRDFIFPTAGRDEADNIEKWVDHLETATPSNKPADIGLDNALTCTEQRLPTTTRQKFRQGVDEEHPDGQPQVLNHENATS